LHLAGDAGLDALEASHDALLNASNVAKVSRAVQFAFDSLKH
jgi:hypothetical protein